MPQAAPDRPAAQRATRATSADAAPAPPASRLADWLAVAVFALALGAPALDRAFGLDPVPEREPGRAAQGVDALAPGRTLHERIAALQQAAALRFGFRDALVLLHGELSTRLLHTSANPKVLLGRDGWLFLRAEGALDDHRNLRPFPRPLLEKLVGEIDAQQRWLAARGIPYLLVIVPAKPGVYGAQLPAWAAPVRARSRLDSLREALAERTDVDLLDLGPVLRDAARRERVFHRTDSHWNEAGAYAGYRALAQRLGLAALPRDAFRETPLPGFSGDLARMLGLRGVLVETAPHFALRGADRAHIGHSDIPAFAHTPRYKESFRTRAPSLAARGAANALVVRDSFGDALFPFLAQHFSSMRFAWLDSFALMPVLPKSVERERPDLVIHIRVERALMRLGLRGGSAAPGPER